jgi:hypothetical protein
MDRTSLKAEQAGSYATKRTQVHFSHKEGSTSDSSCRETPLGTLALAEITLGLGVYSSEPF